MDPNGVAVLLVEKDGRCGSALESYLVRKGCEICLANSKTEALQLLNRRRFDLVLSNFLLPDGTAYELMPPVRGSSTSMFFFNAVKDGCWWVNAILDGRNHAEDPGMRPAQFKVRLDQLLFTSDRNRFRGRHRHADATAVSVQVSSEKRGNFMRKTNSDPVVWFPTQLPPRFVASFRRWNIVITCILLFMVLGLTVAGIVTGLENRTTTAKKTPVKHESSSAPLGLAHSRTELGMFGVANASC
jgi:hypothetical protein